MCESPNGARKSGGLDFEAERQCAKVQTERGKVADWTLKRWDSVRKSKRSEEKWRIGP